MKVFIWTGGHTIAASLFENPPDGVQVVSNVQAYSRKTGISGERMFVVPNEAKGIVDGIVYSAGIPRFLPSLTSADLIHTVSGIVPIVPKPWITSISMPSSFFGLNDQWSESQRRLWMLKKIIRSRNCRCVTCFSKSTLDGIEFLLKPHDDARIKQKMQVLYPAIDSGKFARKRKPDDSRFRILFVGNHFFDKGGRELHRSVARLSKKYDVLLDLVTDAPPHHRDALSKYMKCHQEDWVRWHVPGVSRKRLMDEFYPSADAFVMCSYMEVFGFVFLEAMASGLPTIAANVYAQREIISHGENGYLIDIPISPFDGAPQLRTRRSVERYRHAILDEKLFDPVVNQMTDSLETLIEDSATRARMSRESLRMTTDGRFGLAHRNRQLKEIYEAALD